MSLMRYEWDARLSVNSKEIDRQHQAMLRLMNDLHFAMLQGKGREKVVKLLEDLKVIAEEHFSFEEKYMLQMAYPAIKSHKDMHAEFSRKLDDFVYQTINQSIGLPVHVMNFLKDWLMVHITVEDKKYAEFATGHFTGSTP